MVQGLGLAKKYLERINEIAKLDDGSYNITYVNNVKINYITFIFYLQYVIILVAISSKGGEKCSRDGYY